MRGERFGMCAACALRISSGKIILYFAFGATAFAERSVAIKAPVGLLSGRAVCVSRWRGFAPTSSAERSKRIFTGRVMEGNGICSAAFCESAALRGSTPSVIAYGDATFPKGTAFRGGGKLCGSTERRPLGGAVA